MLHVIFRREDGTYESRRYAIRGKLRAEVRKFDDSRRLTGTGEWNLESGIYHLDVPSGTEKRGVRPNRRHKYGGKGGKQQMGERVMQVHTRRILGATLNQAA